MKFELKPYNRNISDENLLIDLKKVASELKLDSLSKEEYEKNGKYNSSTLHRRFGSWTNALKLAKLQIRKNHKVSTDDFLDDLKRVANEISKKSVTLDEYNERGKFHGTTFVRRFGSWFDALEKAGLQKTRTPMNLPEEELFKNLEEIWIKLGRQPRYVEVQKPLSKYHAGTYENRFGSWRKALEAFIKYVNEGKNIQPEKEETIKLPLKSDAKVQNNRHKTNRNINWRLRFIVMRRDNFKCKKCGRSPAIDPTIVLHVDHTKAWANGGETILENLQTLCSKCNIGKSDLE